MSLENAAPEYDAVIVGSGIAGALVAYKLVQAGWHVLVLEAGGVPPDSLGRWAMVRNFISSPSKLPDAPFCGDDVLAPQPVPSAGADGTKPKTYYEHAAGSDPFKSYYERVVGGSTWHWQGIYLRMLPNDFKMRSKYGVGVDWPISYETLERWYARAEKEMGVAGDDREMQVYYQRIFRRVGGAPRRLDYPMGPLAPSYLDSQISRAINRRVLDDTELRVTTVPHAINSREYDGRPACDGRTSCVPLCSTRARYDATVHLERAMRLGAVLRTQAVVTRLELDESRNRVTRVHYIRWNSKGDTFTPQTAQPVSARVVILAANGIENPMILLRSKAANTSGTVGCYLMDHPIKQSLGLAPQKLFPFRGPQTTSNIETFRDGEFRKRYGAFKTSIKNDGWSTNSTSLWPRGVSVPDKTKYQGDDFPGTIVHLVENRGYVGKGLREKLEDHATRQITLNSACEQLPIKENCVTESTNLDLAGITRPQIHYRVNKDPYVVGSFNQIVRLHNFVFDSLKIPTQDRYFVNPDPPDALIYGGSGHIMGTTRMGNKASDSVVTRDCRSHDHRNLFVVGSSVFPTGATANPTSTIAALALRTAAHIVEERKKGSFNV